MSCPVTPGPGVAVTDQKKKSSDDLTGWQSKFTTLLSRTSFLVNTREMSDVEFIFKTKEGTEETIIYGHKLILAMGSPVFQKMFFNENPDLLTPVGDKVEMKDHPFSAEAFLTFVKFLYTDKINYVAYEGLSTELILGILNCADYYDVPYLKTDCVKQLQKIITRTNVIQILEAAMVFEEDDLACQVLEVIDKNLNFVFESEEILSVKMEALFVILNRDSLDLDECFVLDLALKWAEHECKRKSLEPTAENKRKVLGPVFFEIRYALLTSDRIFELVASNLLSLEESLHICLAVHNPGHLTKSSTTPGGSKWNRNATVNFIFESKPRVFGQKMELMESKKMEEKWKGKNNLAYWKSLAKVQADLIMGGFSRSKNDFEIEEEIGRAGFDTDLCVRKLRENPRTFRVKFAYNPSVYKSAALLDPNTYGFSNAESIEIKKYGSR